MPELLKILVSWPKRIEKFSFIMPITGDDPAHTDLDEPWDLEDIDPIFRLHSQTLTHIKIGTFEKPNWSQLNLGNYPVL